MKDEQKDFPEMELKFTNEPTYEEINEMVRKRNEILKQMGYQIDEQGKITKEQKKAVVYIKLTSGLIVKIIPEELTAYRLNEESLEWQKDSVLFTEYEHGNLVGEKFDTNENYPIGEPFKYGRHL